jgi:putative oxidoreductase
MLALHGWQKLINYSSLTATFPDPLGVGSIWSLVLALCGEVLCQILLMLGFVTRLAALGAAVTMGVAWYAVHKMALIGPQSGELAFIYLAGYVVLVLTGAGRYSLDGTAGAGGGSSRVKPQAPKK